MMTSRKWLLLVALLLICLLVVGCDDGKGVDLKEPEDDVTHFPESDATDNVVEEQKGEPEIPITYTQKWNGNFTADDYFVHCNTQREIGGESTVFIDYAVGPEGIVTRNFDEFFDKYQQIEMIPVVEGDVNIRITGSYREENNELDSVAVQWWFDDFEPHDICVLYGPKEVEMRETEITYEYDKKGKRLEDLTTITERNGIEIVAKGKENRKKTITFQNESGWYQIQGNHFCTYGDMLQMLEWFLAHPIDSAEFSIEKGNLFEHEGMETCPEEFAKYVPDYQSMEYYRDMSHSGYLLSKNGQVYGYTTWFKKSDGMNISWDIYKEKSYLDEDVNIYLLEEITREKLGDCVGEYEFLTCQFEWDGHYFKIAVDPHENNVDALWQIISTWKETLK